MSHKQTQTHTQNTDITAQEEVTQHKVAWPHWQLMLLRSSCHVQPTTKASLQSKAMQTSLGWNLQSLKVDFFGGVAYSTVRNKCCVTIENMATAIVTYILVLVCYAPHINVLTSQMVFLIVPTSGLCKIYLQTAAELRSITSFTWHLQWLITNTTQHYCKFLADAMQDTNNTVATNHRQSNIPSPHPQTR